MQIDKSDEGLMTGKNQIDNKDRKKEIEDERARSCIELFHVRRSPDISGYLTSVTTISSVFHPK